jgi:DNA-binding NtrC family response regulator
MANENYTLDQVIEGYCNAVLKEHLQNRTHAADQLGISVRTFQRWLRRWAFKNNKMPQQLPTSNMTVLM